MEITILKDKLECTVRPNNALMYKIKFPLHYYLIYILYSFIK